MFLRPAAIALFATWFGLPHLAMAADPPVPDSTPGATTSTLQANPQFFPEVPSDKPTTLPLVSVVAGETSTAEGLVTAPEDPDASTSLSSSDSTETLEVSIEEPTQHLPIQVDKSSTASQTQQLERFEKKNQMAEAFLLACELVRSNPNAEFAYDAAIRTSLVLRLPAEAENFYKLAIRNARLGGKYYVQLAHFYSRIGKSEPLAALIADYEKNNVRDPDYWITLSRLHMVTGDAGRTRESIERAFQQKVTMFPLSLLLTHALQALNLPDKARENVIAAADLDFGPWEKHELLLEYVKLPGISPEQISTMVRAALVNESDYHRARKMADEIIRRAIEERIFHPLKQHLAQNIAAKNATDIEFWLLARLCDAEGNTTEALSVLTHELATSTPVISYERAMAFAVCGRTAEAIPILNVLLAEQPTEVPVRLTLAEQYLVAGKPARVLQVLSGFPLQDLTPPQRLKWCQLAMSAAVAHEDPARSIEQWIELSRVATFVDLQAMGDVVLKARPSKEAREKLIHLLDARIQRTDGWRMLLLRARLSAQQRDHQSELRFYSQYLERDPENVQMLRFVAELATQYATLPVVIGSGRDGKGGAGRVTVRATDNSGTDLAIDLYRRLINLQPMVPDNYAALMRIYQTRGEVETAKKVAIELAGRDAKSAEVQALAASILDESGFAADALSFYKAALEMEPDNIAVQMKYAGALRETKEFADAAKIYRSILENGLHGKPYNQPQVFAAMLRLANANRDLAALATYLDGLRQKDIPGKPEFYLSSSKLLMQIGADDRAEAFLKEFGEKYPDHRLAPDSLLLLGQLYYNKQDAGKAVEVFRSVVDKFPGTPGAVTAAYNIGEVHRQTGQPKMAIDAWAELAKTNPANDKALSAMQDAAMVALNDLKDKQLAASLLKQLLESSCQDFRLLEKARATLQEL